MTSIQSSSAILSVNIAAYQSNTNPVQQSSIPSEPGTTTSLQSDSVEISAEALALSKNATLSFGHGEPPPPIDP